MSLQDFTKRFKVSLSASIQMPKGYWYAQILRLIQKWRCYLSCDGETKTVTSRVSSTRIQLRQPEPFARKTFIAAKGGPFVPLGLVTSNTGPLVSYSNGGGEAPTLDVTITISWSGGDGTDVDIRGVMGDEVRGWAVNAGSADWFQWTSLDNTNGGPEQLFVNSSGAREALGLSTSDPLTIALGAGWYTLPTYGDATVLVECADGRSHSFSLATTVSNGGAAAPGATPAGVQSTGTTISIPPYPGAITHT